MMPAVKFIEKYMFRFPSNSIKRKAHHCKTAISGPQELGYTMVVPEIIGFVISLLCL